MVDITVLLHLFDRVVFRTSFIPRHLYTSSSYCLAFSKVEEDEDGLARLDGAYLRLCPEEDAAGQEFLTTKAYPICCLVRSS